MRRILIALFAAILVAMIVITTLASMQQNIFAAGKDLLTDRWFVATLFDAYFGFITFYVWVAYKELTLARRLLWFVLIMCLGNIAMAVYMLIQLARLEPQQPVSALLLRSSE